MPTFPSLLIAVIAAATLFAPQSRADEEPTWQQLVRNVEERRVELVTLISEARAKGITTDYAAVSAQVIAAFQKAAKHDHENVEQVRKAFQAFGYYKKLDPTEADTLATKELNACLEVADHAISELRGQVQGEIELSPPPDLAQGRMTLAADTYLLDGRPVFPSSLVWLTRDEEMVQALGRIGQGYFAPSFVKEDLTVSRGRVDAGIRSATEAQQRNLSPYVFFFGHSAASWMKQQHPEILHGARHFTHYDIDSPLVRKWIEVLCRDTLPDWSRAAGDLPRIHLLANEPHFATRKWGWLSKNGLSDHTIAKYHAWLELKYATIAKLNETYGSNHKSFDQVSFHQEDPKKHPADEAFRARQIDSKHRGGPLWHDWCRFNMDRVNDWFSFLKKQTRSNDGVGAPVSIKMLGFTLSRNQRDGGMDIEHLTKLQDICGADLRVAPRDAIFLGKHEEGMDPETGWRSRYAYDWVEQSMYLDFTKSLCPDKLFYDSEWHGFGAVSWRHFKLDRDYVRSALWMAFCDGMGMIKPWLWGRNSEGALSRAADHIGELATQPVAVDAYGRVMKELNAHADWLVPGRRVDRRFMIYYCEEAAIQDPDYTGGFSDIYEALKLLNLPVGFATPSTAAGLDPGRQTLIVSPTPFIADASLAAIRTFKKSGGRVVLVGAENSFRKNELGAPRSGDEIAEPFASLPQRKVTAMLSELGAKLKPLAPTPDVSVSFTDESGADAHGVITRQCRHPKSGDRLLVLNNVSKDRRIVHLEPTGATPTAPVDVITRQVTPKRLAMDPCAVRVLALPR